MFHGHDFMGRWANLREGSWSLFCAEKLVITTNRCWLDFFCSRFWPNFGDLFLTPSFAQEPHFFDNDEEFALGASHYASWHEKFSQPVKPAENLGFLAAFELNACLLNSIFPGSFSSCSPL